MVWKNDQVSEEETRRILELAREALVVEGDYVEMGCYKGDTSLLLAEIVFPGPRPAGPSTEVVRTSSPRESEPARPPLDFSDGLSWAAGANARAAALRNAQKRQHSAKHHRLFIYDSFEGLPEKTSQDESVLGADFRGGELSVTKREVKARFLRSGLPVPVIKKGWFSDLWPDDLPEKIAFAFLDGDFYDSIRDSLRLVTPRMANGGVMVVHDYTNPALPGVKKAVDEWGIKGREFDVVRL